MDQSILDFLNKERVCALTILLNDGTPHSAALHFSSSTENGLKLYFSTERSSRKCDFLKTSTSTKASVVMGFSEQEWKTLQLDGEVKLLEGEELAKAKEVHYAKNPESKKYEHEPETLFLEFTTKWSRYSDLSQHPPKIVAI